MITFELNETLKFLINGIKTIITICLYYPRYKRNLFGGVIGWIA